MKATSQQIRERLQKQWSDLEYIWLWDNTYWKPLLHQAEKLLKSSRVSEMKFIPQFNDCDNFALQWLAEVRRKRYFAHQENNLPPEQIFPVSIGFCFGNEFRGMAKLHAANIMVAKDDKIYIIDTTPMENRIWEASDKDNILFVFM